MGATYFGVQERHLMAQPIRWALSFTKSLLPLVKATGGLEQAKRELRWIQKELPRAKWAEAISRRAKHEPLQYILGSQPFGELTIKCRPGTLIPRWETEEWTTALADQLKKFNGPLSILDACTGSGCVPLLLKHELPESKVCAFDVSDSALQLAKENRDGASLEVEILSADVLHSDVAHSFSDVSIVTSNPPYIPAADYERPLDSNGPELSVRMFEPRLALVGHLEFYTALVNNVVLPLDASGFVFELGYEDQAAHTRQLLPSGWTVGRYMDSASNLRCVVGWKQASPMTLLEPLVNGGYL